MAPNHWRTSSYSTTDGGNCVETRRLTGRHQVRDTKNRDGGIVSIKPTAWHRFVTAVTSDRI